MMPKVTWPGSSGLETLKEKPTLQWEQTLLLCSDVAVLSGLMSRAFSLVAHISDMAKLNCGEPCAS